PVFSRSSPDPVAPLLSGIKNLLAPPMQGFLLWFVIPSAPRNLLFRWGGNSLFYIGYRAFALLRGLNLHHNVLQPHRQTSACIRPVLVFEENIRYPIAGRALARIQHYLLADPRRMQECRCRSKALVAVPEFNSSVYLRPNARAYPAFPHFARFKRGKLLSELQQLQTMFLEDLHGH